jgi:NADPH:quinone reductase-like Zn-dependent oxidoreductase
VGKETLARSYGVVKKGGIVLHLVARPDPAELEKRGIRGAAIWVRPDAKDLSEIAHLIDAGKIKPVVTQVLPLSEAIAAQRQAETHHTRGKVVLRIADCVRSYSPSTARTLLLAIAFLNWSKSLSVWSA